MNISSSQNQKFRLLIDPEPCSGQTNMAVDEMLLDQVSETGIPVFRLYQWTEPTISLGYFQKPEEAVSENRFESLPHVKRLSGGGAILHHHELTYSLTLPSGHPLTLDPVGLYPLVHHAIIETLEEFGISSMMRGETRKEQNSLFLCFGRGDENDLLIGSEKIVGSAQRRRKGNILQHGSLLLESSEHAPEFRGILEITGKEISLEELKESLTGTLSRQLNCEWINSELNEQECLQVEKLIREKYQFMDWSKI